MDTTQLKCPWCGAALSLTDEKCPYCGRINEAAKNHAEDMKRFRTEFEETRQAVVEEAKSTGRITARAIILGILVLACIVVTALNANAYSIRRSLRIRDTKKHAVEYTWQMNELLIGGDYREFASFCQSHYISSIYDNSLYKEYDGIISAAQSYEYVCSTFDSIIFPASYMNPGDKASRLQETLKSYYDRISPDAYGNEEMTERKTRAYAGMSEDIRLMLTVYLGISEEDAAAFPGMTEGQRLVILEEAINAKME